MKSLINRRLREAATDLGLHYLVLKFKARSVVKLIPIYV